MQNGNSTEPTSDKCPVINLELSSNPLVVLGYAAAGQPSAKASYAQLLVQRTVSALEPLSKLGHSQGEACILRFCGPTSRLRHLLRYSQEEAVHLELLSADHITLTHAERIVGRPAPEG